MYLLKERKRIFMRLANSVSISAVLLVVQPANASPADQPKKDVIKIKAIQKNMAYNKHTAKVSVPLNENSGTPHAYISKNIINSSALSTNAITALNSAPGINATSTNPIGVKPHISVRGFSATQIGYTFDGLPLGDIYNGGLTAGNANAAGAYNLVPITNGAISGISIYYGPAPSDILSIGGLGGTIEYQPRLPKKQESEDIFGGYGSFNTRDYGVSYNSGTIKNMGNIYIRFSSRQTGNYVHETPDREYSYYASYVFPTDYGTKFTAIFMLNNNQGYIPQRAPVSLIGQNGYGFQFPKSLTYQQANATSAMGIIDYKTILSHYLVTNLKAYYSYSDFNSLKYENPTLPLTANYNGSETSLFPATFSSDPTIGYQPSSLSGVDYHSYLYKTQTIGINPKLNIFLSKSSFSIGALALMASYNSSIYWYNSPNMPKLDQYNDAFDEHGYRLYTKLYAQGFIRPIHNLTISPGISYETESTHFTDVPGYFYAYGATSNKSFNEASPYIGISYKLLHGLNVFGSYSMAYKFPNVSAFYSNDSFATATTPAPPITIKPEGVDSYQLGLSYKNKDLDFGATVYRESFNNTFSNYFNPTNGLTYVYNFAPSIRQGIDISGSYAISNILRLFATYSIQNASYGSSFTSRFGTFVNGGTPIQYVPTYLVNIGLSTKYQRFSSRLWGVVTGPQYAGSSTGVPTGHSISAYGTLNASLKYSIPYKKMGIKKATIGVVFDNILNNTSLIYEKQFPTYDGSSTYFEGETLMPRFIGANFNLKF